MWLVSWYLLVVLGTLMPEMTVFCTAAGGFRLVRENRQTSAQTLRRGDRVLYRLVRKNWRSGAQKLRRDLLRHLNVVLSRRTDNRRLQSRGYKARRIVKVPRGQKLYVVNGLKWISIGQLVTGDMSYSVMKAYLCSSGSTTGSVYVGWFEKPRMKIVFKEIWLTVVDPFTSFTYGVVSTILVERLRPFYRQILEEDLVPHAGPRYANNWILADDNARPLPADYRGRLPPTAGYYETGLGPL